MDGLLKSIRLRSAALAAALFTIAANAPAFADGDAGHGESLFKTRCSVCHRAEKGAHALIGPPLWGVVGRAAGTEGNFPYSTAMKNSGLTWSQTQLVTYLKAPMNVVPGTKMTFIGLKAPGDAEAVAAYLATLK